MKAIDILKNKLEKMNISSGEYDILVEYFEDDWESFEEEIDEKKHRKPDDKEIDKFIKDFLERNAIENKPPMRQVDKEKGQMECLMNAFKRDRKHLSLEEMSDLLIRSGYPKGSSVKTIYKRIKPLLEAQDKIKKDSDGKFYYEINEEEIRFAKERMSNIEARVQNYIESVNILSNFLETIKDSPVYEQAKKFVEFEKENLTRGRREKIKNQKSSSRIVFLGAPEINIDTKVWNAIYEAMVTNSVINITYLAEGKSEAKSYTVKPFQMIYDNGLWELWGECLDLSDKGRKLFNISRISHVSVRAMIGKFFLPDDYDFLKTLSGSFGCYTDEKLQHYKIKFEKDSYAWLYSKNRIWGDNQTVDETSEGFILTFEAKQFKPILRWILGWGDEVTPLEPQELVGEWKQKIAKMMEKAK